MRMQKFLLLICLLLLALPSCAETAPQVDRPQEYSKNGLTLTYPGNWKVDSDENLEGGRVLLLESPDNAIITVFILNDEDERDLEQIAKDYVEIFKDSLPEGFTTTTTSLKAVEDTRWRELFRIDFMGEFVPHIREYKVTRPGPSRVVFVSQVASEDRDIVLPAFKMIEDTLKLK